MSEVSALSAAFFLIENPDDVNDCISQEEFQQRREEAETFLRMRDHLREALYGLPEDFSAEDAMFQFYETGKMFFGEKNLRRFFSLLYMAVSGSVNGPRIGLFFRIFGRDNFFERLDQFVNDPLRLRI